MNQRERKTIAAQIASRLFLDGVGRKARRLVLEYPDRHIDGTAWVEEAVAGLVEKMLLGYFTAEPAEDARPARRPTRTKARS